MPLRHLLSDAFHHIQGRLFPLLRAEVGSLMPEHERLVAVLGMACVETLVTSRYGMPGRPPEDRQALARAFIAKAVFDLPTTTALIGRLHVDHVLRRLCGWEYVRSVPSEATFSRAFAELAASALPERLHEALIDRTLGHQLVGHIARDATAIEARERPCKVDLVEPAKPRRRRGRPRNGETVALQPPRRLTLQPGMSLPQMLGDLPTYCSVGAKRNARGHTSSWIGYKLHIDTADGDIPVSCILTSAHVHDSQVAIPLATMTAQRVSSLYDLMDSAYDAPEIADHSRGLGHVPIINRKTRRGEKDTLAAEARAQRVAGHVPAEHRRYDQRSASERVNSNLKDNRGGRHVRVRGAAKVFCHLMFGILVITAEQLLAFVQ